MWHVRWRSIGAWRIPPNWSAHDWHEEVRAQGAAAALQAEQDYDATRGPSRDAFVRGRVLASVLTRYRQEWSYARHCRPDADGRCDVTKRGALDSGSLAALRESLALLSETERHLLHCLFWEGHTEAEVASALATSQATISRRKRTALEGLRRWLGESDGIRPWDE